MAKQIPDDFLAKIREIDIIEVAESYFKLEQMGNIHRTTCIHPGDKTPSLTFFTQTNTFYCFGCGAGKKPKTEGSEVISFVMWMDNCSFSEAVQRLAVMKGWPVPKLGLSDEDKKKLKEIESVLKANRQYWEHLQTNVDYLQYLKDRGIEKEEVDKWRIGSIPKEGSHFHKGKLTFALMNDWGQTVGFSHRNMSDKFDYIEDPSPKYVNSPKSTIFDKGSILYGLNFVKRLIREKGYVIVGEGFGDAILGQKMGLPFVATMGTSLTDQHIAILKQYSETVILWMDGDQAGINATSRHAKVLQKAGFIVKVINYLGKDPDDVFMDILLNHKEDMQDYTEKLVLTQSVLASQFEINQILSRFDSQVAELKMKICREVMPILSDIPQSIEKDIFYEMVSRRIDVSVETLKGGELNVREERDAPKSSGAGLS